MIRPLPLEMTIVKAAKELVIEQGLDALNARNVAKRAQCSVGTLYNYFKNMSELILIINSETLQALKEELKKAMVIPTREFLSRSISRAYLSYVRSNRSLWRLLYEYSWPRDLVLPDWYQAIIKETFTIIEQSLRPYLSADSKEAYTSVRMLWAGMHGILMLEMTGKLDIAHKEPAEDLCDSLFDHYLNG